jgi:hypothetical protein
MEDDVEFADYGILITLAAVNAGFALVATGTMPGAHGFGYLATAGDANGSFNVTGDLTVGYGNVDVNSMILGYQEHSNKVDTTALYGNEPYLGYCRGTLTVTNGGVGNGLVLIAV